jgi:hypothetical protein
LVSRTAGDRSLHVEPHATSILMLFSTFEELQDCCCTHPRVLSIRQLDPTFLGCLHILTPHDRLYISMLLNSFLLSKQRLLRQAASTLSRVTYTSVKNNNRISKHQNSVSVFPGLCDMSNRTRELVPSVWHLTHVECAVEERAEIIGRA